jgi:hypothetical protein
MTNKVYLVWHRDDVDHGRHHLYGIHKDKDGAISHAKKEISRPRPGFHPIPEVFPPGSDQYNDAEQYCEGNHLVVAVGRDGYWCLTVEETPLLV